MSAAAIKTVQEIVLQTPSAIPLFESLGIDYCCGGERTLAEACARAEVDEPEVSGRLARLNNPPHSPELFLTIPLSLLVRHIVEAHHVQAREQLQLLSLLGARAVRTAGARHPRLYRIREQMADLADEFSVHMLKEERVLFPYIERLDESAASHMRLPLHSFRGLGIQLRVMRHEHDVTTQLADALASALAQVLSESASSSHERQQPCAAVRELAEAFETWRKALHLHLHLENNVLFPRAERLEEELALGR